MNFVGLVLASFILISTVSLDLFAQSEKQIIKPSTNTALSKQLNEEGIAAIKADRLDKAVQLFENSIKADSGNITAAFNLAGVLLNNKDTEKAVSLLKHYIQLFPKDAGLYVRLADCYFSQKLIDLAATNYEKGFTIEPKYPRLSSKLGTVYGLKGKIKEAERMYRIAVQDNPEDLQSLENLAVLLVANNKAKEAIPLIKTAIRLDSSPELYDLLGQAYQASGDKENAEISFGRAKSLGIGAIKPK